MGAAAVKTSAVDMSAVDYSINVESTTAPAVVGPLNSQLCVQMLLRCCLDMRLMNLLFDSDPSFDTCFNDSLNTSSEM